MFRPFFEIYVAINIHFRYMGFQSMEDAPFMNGRNTGHLVL